MFAVVLGLVFSLVLGSVLGFVLGLALDRVRTLIHGLFLETLIIQNMQENQLELDP